MLDVISRLSLDAQEVNSLPWELNDKVAATIQRLSDMGDATRVMGVSGLKKWPSLQPGATPGSCPAELFPLLHAAEPGKESAYTQLRRGEFNGMKLNLSHRDSDLLADPESDDPSDWLSLEQSWCVAVDQLHDLLSAITHFAKLEFEDFVSAPRQGEHGGHQRDDVHARSTATLIRYAGQVFDLRSEAPASARKEALCLLHGTAIRAGLSLAPVAVYYRQLEVLVDRLAKARTQTPYSVRWFDPATGAILSGTVIMQDLFTTPSLYDGIPPILWLFQYFALKTANEAVNEAMGGAMDVHAAGLRNLQQDKYVAETFVHWNGPPLVNARPLLVRALDIHFKDKDWHFKPTSRHGQTAYYARGQQSLVVERKRKEACKLPLLRGVCKCTTCAT